MIERRKKEGKNEPVAPPQKKSGDPDNDSANFFDIRNPKKCTRKKVM